MADQKISELQLVVATGVAATGIYVPLQTPMLAPANRRISAAELFKTPKRVEISDSALAGNGEVLTLTSSYGTVSLRAGTAGQFVVGGDAAAVGSISVVSDSAPLTLGISNDVKLYRDASGVLGLRYDRNPQAFKLYNSHTGSHNEYVTLRFLSGTAQVGTFQDGTGIARSLDILTSGVARISAPAASGSPVTITSYDTAQGGALTLISPLGTANLRVGAGGQLVNVGNFASIGEVAVLSDSSALKLGIFSDVGLVRSASGVARVTDISTSNYGALEAKRFAATYGTISGVTIPIISGSQTWSDASNIFTAVLVNVTDTNSHSSSKLFDFQVAGVTTTAGTKRGSIYFPVSFGNGTALPGPGIGNYFGHLGLYGTGGAQLAYVSTAGISTNGASTGFLINDDVVLTRDAADILAQRRSGNAQMFRAYETFTDSSNYSRGVFGFRDSAGVATTTFRIGTEASGTGTARAVSIVTGGTERLNISASSNVLTMPSNSTLALGTNGVLRTQYVNDASNAVSSFELASTGHVTFSVGTTAPLFRFSGTTLSFPALKRSGTAIHARLADDSAYTSLIAGSVGLDTDLLLTRPAANILGITNGSTGPGTLAIDNVQGTNYERVRLDWSANVARIGTERGGSGIARNFELQASGISRLTIPAASGSPITITSYDTSQGGVLDLTSPLGTANLRVGAGGQLVSVGSFAVLNEIALVSNLAALKLGSLSDVGFLRSASGVARVVGSLPSSTDYGSLEAKRLLASGTLTGVTSPALAVTQTWNNVTTDFTAVTVDIIPQNAGSNSNFIEFKSSGTSYAKLTQFGDFQSSSFTPADLGTRMGSSGIKIGTAAQYTFVNSTSAASSAIAAGLTLGGSGVVRVTDGFANTGSITVRNTNSTVFTITDATGVDINPASGAIQVWTLGASRTPTANNFNAGQSVTLMIDDGSSFTVNWGTMGVSWLNSTPPALPSSGYGVVELWKVGSTIYGTSVGNVV